VVKVPATFKSPDKLKFPPVKVVAEIVPPEMFVEIILVFNKVGIVAVVTLALVNCALLLVKPDDKLSVALEIFVETAFVFNKVAIVEVVTLAFVILALDEVKPVDKFNVPELTFVPTIFVDVTFVKLIVPDEILYKYRLDIIYYINIFFLYNLKVNYRN
jgi:hypothetical protein